MSRKDNKTEELMMLIMNAGRLLHQRLHGVGKISPVSMLQFKILCFISQKGAPSMKDLAGFLGITPPSATVIVRRLVEHGLLKHVSPGGDHRTVRIALTSAGERNIKASRRAMVKAMDMIISRLNRNETRQLVTILNKLLKAE